MKRLPAIFFLILYVSVFKISAQTTIETGFVSGTWTEANSPYLINGNITVDTTETLIIEPGVAIVFQDTFSITVDGYIKARSTPGNKIKFTASDTAGYPGSYAGWRGIKIRETDYLADTTIFENCIFNYAKRTEGGVLYIDRYNDIIISDCIFRYNFAESGGAIYFNQSSQCSILNSKFLNNRSSGYGGALYIFGASPDVINNVFAYNEADQAGALFFSSSNSYIINNTIVYNDAFAGGGISYQASNCKVYNNIIWYNEADYGSQIYLINNDGPPIYNSNIQGGIDAMGGTSFKDDYINCIDIIPDFANPDDLNFSLNENSSCINSGLDTIPSYTLPDVDINHDPRIYSGDVEEIDMGAYEYQGEPVNRPPFIAKISDKQLFPDNSHEFDYNYTDFDLNDTVTVDISSNNENVTAEIISDAAFRLTALNSWKGNVEITITLTDKGDLNTIETFNVIVDNIISTDIYEDASWYGDTVYLSNDVTVHHGATLQIAPGTVVASTGFYELLVEGTLDATGTNEDLIVFTVTDTSGYHNLTHTGWNGIKFNEISAATDTSHLSYCIIEYGRSNTNFIVGGGIEVYRSDNVTIDHCTFRYNYGSSGPGALSVNFSQISLTNNYFYNNFTGSSAGNVYIYNSSNINFVNNCIANNGSDVLGHCGLYLYAGSPTIKSSTICYNWGGPMGGVQVRNANVFFENTIIYHNGDDYDAGIAVTNGSAEFSFCNIQGGAADIGGGPIYYNSSNIEAEPHFVNPPSDNTYKVSVPLDGFKLSPLSPCIDKGTPDTLGIYQFDSDIVGQDRAVNDTVDMGCFEFYNYPPQFVPNLPDVHLGQDVDFNYSISQLTVDSTAGDVLVYNAERLDEPAFPAWLSFNTLTGTFTGTPEITDLDTLQISITVTDILHESITDTFTLYIVYNEKPVLANSIPDYWVHEDEYTVTDLPDDIFSDADVDDSLSYTIHLSGGGDLPDWLIFNSDSLKLSGTARNDDVGILNFVLTATDSRLAWITDTFNLEIININDPPELRIPLEDQEINSGTAFSLTFPEDMFEDVDLGDILDYDAELSDGTDLPEWLDFTSSTRTFSGTPSISDAGVITVRLIAFDNALEEVYDEFTITIISIVTGAENTLTSPVAIYPNPANNKLYISNLLYNQKMEIEIIDMNGQIIHSQKLEKIETEIEISSLQAGIYFIKLKRDEEINVIKFVKN